jgi:hypothetical protein
MPRNFGQKPRKTKALASLYPTGYNIGVTANDTEEQAMNIAIIPMVWSEQGTNGSMEHCVCCGKKLRGKRRMVEVIDGGRSVAAPGLGPDTTDSGYMGFYPVGPECARKHFRGFTHDCDEFQQN